LKGKKKLGWALVIETRGRGVVGEKNRKCPAHAVSETGKEERT